MTYDEALDRLRKLLALGESDNVNESAQAIARAQALMERFQITETLIAQDAVNPEPEEPLRVWEEPIDRAQYMASWKSNLTWALCKPNGLYWFHRSGNIHVVGRASDAETVRYLFGYCAKEIDRLTKREAYGKGHQYCFSFRMGCVDAIREAIKNEQFRVREEMRGAVPDERALIKLDNALATSDERHALAVAFARSKASGLHLRSGGTSSFRNDASGHAHGQQAGRGIYPGRSRRGGRLGSSTRSLPR